MLKTATMLRQVRPVSAFGKSSLRILQAAWGESRTYSVKAEAASATKIKNIDPAQLKITQSKTPKTLLPPNELVFGRTFTGKRDSIVEKVESSY